MKSLAEVEEAISSSILLRPVLPHAPLLRSPAPPVLPCCSLVLPVTPPSAPFISGVALFPRPKWQREYSYFRGSTEGAWGRRGEQAGRSLLLRPILGSAQRKEPELAASYPAIANSTIVRFEIRTPHTKLL